MMILILLQIIIISIVITMIVIQIINKNMGVFRFVCGSKPLK